MDTRGDRTGLPAVPWSSHMVDLLASDHREQRQGQAGPPQLLGLRDAVALRVPLSQYP